ncbi:MAG: hypothetical protein AAF399_07665 [Bacteroidota bacterium]
MKPLLLLLAFSLSLPAFAQTRAYLEDITAPGSVEDIVHLLGLQNAKKISVYSRKMGRRKLRGEIWLNQAGTCIEKRSYQSDIWYHSYDEAGRLKEVVYLSDKGAAP